MNSKSTFPYFNPTILFADRDPVFAETVRRMLHSDGHSVLTCTNGLECLQILKEKAPAVLVLDANILWGGGDGIIDWLSSEESTLPQMIVRVIDSSSQDVPDRLAPWIDLRLTRPESTDQLLPFVNQLKTLIWWSESPQVERTTPAARQKVRTASLNQCGQSIDPRSS